MSASGGYNQQGHQFCDRKAQIRSHLRNTVFTTDLLGGHGGTFLSSSPEFGTYWKIIQRSQISGEK